MVDAMNAFALAENWVLTIKQYVWPSRSFLLLFFKSLLYLIFPSQKAICKNLNPSDRGQASDLSPGECRMLNEATWVEGYMTTLLGVRVSTYDFVGNTIQPTTQSMPEDLGGNHSLWFLVLSENQVCFFLVSPQQHCGFLWTKSFVTPRCSRAATILQTLFCLLSSPLLFFVFFFFPNSLWLFEWGFGREWK